VELKSLFFIYFHYVLKFKTLWVRRAPSLNVLVIFICVLSTRLKQYHNGFADSSTAYWSDLPSVILHHCARDSFSDDRRADFVRPSYLESRIWPDAISRWMRQRNSIRFCADLGKNAMESLPMITEAFGEESVSCTRRVQTQRDEMGEGQSEEHPHHFL
jgi:hypothetical protein